MDVRLRRLRAATLLLRLMKRMAYKPAHDDKGDLLGKRIRDRYHRRGNLGWDIFPLFSGV